MMLNKKINRYVLCVIITLLLSGNANSQESDNAKSFYRHSVEFSPLSPLLNIYGLQYTYSFNQENSLLFGLTYMAIPVDNIGKTSAYGAIIGYVRHFGKGWHAEYSLYPMYDNYLEKVENKYYNSFDLWNEFRFGYQYDFTISDVAAFVKLQVPFGFALYASNKPKSFLDRESSGDNRFFYKAMLIFVGIHF